MEFVPLIALPFLINKILDWVRSILPDTIEAKVLIPISWMLGVAAAFVLAGSDWGAETKVGDKAFADINNISLVLVGLVIGAAAGIVSDFKPNRLTPKQLERAVKQADTLVVDSPNPPPLASTSEKAPARSRRKKPA